MRAKLQFLTYFLGLITLFVTSEVSAEAELQPHRAYYTISMAGRPPLQSTIVDVRGTMMLEVNKVCGGWTVQQLSEIWRYHADETVEHVRGGYITFESEDASVFKFNTFRKIDDVLVADEDIRGRAKKSGKLIEVVYEKPQPIILNLPEGTLFPIQHTKALLRAAEKGENMFPQIVFDGNSSKGASQINTFIGAKKITTDTNVNKESPVFPGQPFWPVRSAVYGTGGTEYEPEYITTQELRTDGIVKQYVIDEGTSKIQGILVRVELLSKEGC